MESKQMHHLSESIFSNKQKLDVPCKGEDVKRRGVILLLEKSSNYT